MMKSILTSAAILICGSMAILPVNAQTGIDNTSLTSSDFRKHVRTFGLVYTLPKEVNDTLAATIAGLLKEDLLNAAWQRKRRCSTFRTLPWFTSTVPTRLRRTRC